MVNTTPKTRLKVGVNKAQIKYIAGRVDNLSYEDVKDIIENLLREVLNLTLGNIELWIEERVPKRTGQLQENLLRHLKSSRVSRGILRIVIGTAINYAADVNEMTTAMVRHHGTWREHSGKKAYAYYYGHPGNPPVVFLDDPKAEGQFFEKLLTFAYDRVLINLARTAAKYKAQISARQLQVLQVKKTG